MNGILNVLVIFIARIIGDTTMFIVGHAVNTVKKIYHLRKKPGKIRWGFETSSIRTMVRTINVVTRIQKREAKE